MVVYICLHLIILQRIILMKFIFKPIIHYYAFPPLGTCNFGNNSHCASTSSINGTELTHPVISLANHSDISLYISCSIKTNNVQRVL